MSISSTPAPSVMRRTRSRAMAVLINLLIYHSASAQSAVPFLKLTGPRVRVGTEVELHKVRGAGLLSDGRIAVANGGNESVIVFTPRGRVAKQFGRLGSGPGDFQMLYYLTTIGDTLVAWDTGLRRMSLWMSDGTLLRTVSLPTITDHIVDIRAVRTSTEYIATLRTGVTRPASGLYVDTVAVISVDAVKEKPTDLGTRAWSYSYFHDEGGATTTYPVPFLGSTLLVSSIDKLVMLPLGDTRVQITRADGSRAATIVLPLSGPTTQGRAKAYGDSLIASVREKDPRWVKRIETVFGSDFPPAKHQAVAQRAVAVGGTVWFQSFPDQRDSTVSWWVVDARRERLVGRVALPRTAQVLGGTDRQVLVLLRDDDGVETVALFDVAAVGR
jgi:hypothetical protein